ncbi:MAG: tnp23 [Pedosphaera sp.]|nr:tnp23 [Pedosphaera sp.]
MQTCSRPHDWKEARRWRALELHQEGWSQREIAEALGVTEGAVSQWMGALAQVDQHRQLHGAQVTTLGADKAYHQKKFVSGCREREVSPHAACKENVQVEGLDGRTTRAKGYQTSQRLRKRVEEIFGWMKTVGGLRKTRYRGIERTQAWVYFVAGAYNLLRMTRLALSAPPG